jgi:hypothetical protein
VEVLLSCVSEVQPRWLARVRDLVLSVRWFGGALSDAPFVVNFVGGGPPGDSRRELEGLGARVRVVERIDSRFPLANKLRMFELHAELDFDVLVGLDCDLVVVDDFSAHVPRSRIGAKPADYDLFSDREWRRLYETSGLRSPTRTLRATSSWKLIGPYFNTGVVTAPHELCAELRRQWGDHHRELMALLDHEPHSIRPDLHVYVWDQVAFALALAAGRLAWAALPVGMNFPCKVPVHRSALRDSPNPLILHHHGRVDPDGFLLRPRSAVAVDAARRFNAVRAERLSLPDPGLRRRRAVTRARRLRDRRRRMLTRLGRHSRRIRDLTRRRATES